MGSQLYDSEEKPETVLLVGIQKDRTGEWSAVDSLNELRELCATAGAIVVDQIVCRLSRPHPGTYIGSGKAQEIADLVKANSISTLVFDEELSPAQGRNLEEIVGTKVVDRTQVILDIFAQHARTREGQMQIELAQLEYLLPRLRHMWTHLERQKGGIGMRGPGEKQMEMDRRRIVERIVRYRRDLEDVKDRRAELRRGRRRHGWSLISLVGYTNAGKSTLLNALTGAGVLAYDQLFATLDPTTRRLDLPNHQPALLTDTVGFIRKLPHHLVDSFKATLEEVGQSDLLLHVVDASHPLVDEQVDAVFAVLRDLGLASKPLVTVLNKMDKPEAQMNRARLLDKLGTGVGLSAVTGQGVEELLTLLADVLRNQLVRLSLVVPMREGRLLSSLRSAGSILAEKYEGQDAELEVSIPHRLLGACEPFVRPGSREVTDG